MSQNTDSIYLINKKNNSLEKVPRTHYKDEDFFQSLLEQYPDLLAGDQMGGETPVRLMLVKREAGIPDAVNASDRWSIDHLMLDQFGIPTLVEVKRSSDTRIRREVVGQLLEYAANIEKYWSPSRIKDMAEKHHGGPAELAGALCTILELDPEDVNDEAFATYWSEVEKNLSTGHLRLLFVADELPSEVRRIIEFLNEKMLDVIVLGVELRQYEGEGIRAMVPRVIGQTEASQTSKGLKRGPYRVTNMTDFLRDCDTDLGSFIENLISAAPRHGLKINWGSSGFSLRAPDSSGKLQTLMYIWPPGQSIKDCYTIAGYLTEDIRDSDLAQRLSQELEAIDGFEWSGQYTIRCELRVDTLQSAQKALGVVYDVAEMLRDEAKE